MADPTENAVAPASLADQAEPDFDPSAVVFDGTSAPDGFAWAQAKAPVAAGTWRVAGVLSFPDHGVTEHVVLMGAAGAKDLNDVLLWCPAVYTGWLPLPKLVEATKGVRFAGQVPIWAKNTGSVDCEVDLRVRFSADEVSRIGPAPAGPDATAAYYASNVWKRTTYLGVPVLKHPCDIWAMQEILYEVRPDLVIETGTFMGGSALFYAETLRSFPSTNGQGRVVTIDVEDQVSVGVKGHYGVTRLRGSSTSPEILAEVGLEAEGEKVLVVLDSDHSYDHVLAELRAYAPLVSRGSYLVTEDTNTPGPAEAVADFLASPEGREFEVDRTREKFGSGFNPGGWLRKSRGGL